MTKKTTFRGIFVVLGILALGITLNAQVQTKDSNSKNKSSQINKIQLPMEGDQNYMVHPNPFTAGTAIQFELPEDAHVQLQIVDQDGNVIVDLINKQKRAGHHTVYWNGTDKDQKTLQSGSYMSLLKIDDNIKEIEVVKSEQ